MLGKHLVGFLLASMFVADTRTQIMDTSMTSELPIKFPGMTSAQASGAGTDIRAEENKTEEPMKDTDPEVIDGPKLNVTAADKRRYLEIAEKVCERYKVIKMEINGEDTKKTCEPIYIPPKTLGKVATIEEFPHMALVGRKKRIGGYDWTCGGSLLSDQFILSAAHCTHWFPNPEYVSRFPQVVQLGGTYVDEATSIVVPISTIITHPNYEVPLTYHDIALIKMAIKVTFTDKIRPACLGVLPPVDESVIATGWGSNLPGETTPRDLRCVLLPIWDTKACNDIGIYFHRRSPEGISSDSQVCAGDKEGVRNTCELPYFQGDSGGPIQIQDGCAWKVVGTTSFGTACGNRGVPAVYALASMDFIVPIVYGTSVMNTITYKWPTNQQSSNNNSQETTSSNIGDSNIELQTNNANVGNNIQPIDGSNNGNITKDQQTTSSANGNFVNNQQTSGSNNGLIIRDQQPTGSNSGTIVKDQQTTANDGNTINNQLVAGSNNRIQSTINTKLGQNLTINNKLEIDIPVNSSLEINTTIKNKKFRTSVTINNNTSIVNTIEIEESK